MANETLRELLNGPQTEETRAVVDEVMDLMHRSLLRTDRLVDDLLRLAEAVSPAPGEVERIDVGRVVERVLEERAPDIQERGIKVEVAADLGEVVADCTHIYQIFANLIGNAIVHNDNPAPALRVAYLGGDSGGRHLYTICDNGSGILEENIGKVFAPFFKAEAGGTGIGLTIVEKIVKVYGGSIRAYNDNGACFEFILRGFEE
jgi:signal transduction histidine kinase